MSDFKVLLRGCTAGTDKDNPKVSWQFWKEITFDSERKFLTCRVNNLNYVLMSLSISKLSLRNVVYGVITWSCSLGGCPCAIILWRACPQMSRRTWLTVSLNYGWINDTLWGKDLFLLTVSGDTLRFILGKKDVVETAEKVKGSWLSFGVALNGTALVLIIVQKHYECIV